MLTETILIAIGGGTIAWTFWWSHKERERKGAAEFLETLKRPTPKYTLTEIEHKFGVKINSIRVNGLVADLDFSYGELLEGEIRESFHKAIAEHLHDELVN